jgi:Holliday junction resolvase
MIGEGNHNKAAGTRRERKAKALLEDDGYLVVRAAGSLGKADLVAVKPGQVLLVQVKSEVGLSPTEWNDLWAASIKFGCTPMHCAVLFRKVEWRRITGPKRPYERNPPWEMWTADEVAS